MVKKDDDQKYGAAPSWRSWVRSYRGIITLLATAVVVLNLTQFFDFFVAKPKEVGVTITGGALFDRSNVQEAKSKESGRYSVDTGYWSQHHEERPYIEEVFKRTADSRASSACTDFARIGGDGDGGKIICMENENHDSMSFRIGSQAKSDKPCVIYSLGSNAQFGFERAALAATSCDIYTFDCTVSWDKVWKAYHVNLLNPRVHYLYWCIGSKDEVREEFLGIKNAEFKSLTSIMKTLGHEEVDLLKMDIEAYEYYVITETLSGDVPKPKQISFELHPNHYFFTTGEQYNEVWSALDRYGYDVIAYEPNIESWSCCEYTILLRD